MKKLVTAIIGAAVVTLVTSGNARAASFLATGDGKVGTIDTSTGSFTPVFTNGVNWGDIGFSNTNELFGDSVNINGDPDQLYRVNLDSNTLTLIGDLGVQNVAGLDFNPTNNQVYGTTFAGGFYNINTSTGAATLVANIPNFSTAGDIVFDPGTNAFFATSFTPTDSTLFSIAPNGTASQIGNIGFKNVFGLIEQGNTLYGFTADGKQITIDKTTGLGTFDRNVTGLTGTIVGASSEATAVPEPRSVLGVVAGGILLTGSAIKGRFIKKTKITKGATC
ncbi:MAG: DUF4394 domain-containing protein [Nostoc sp.]|uniref:DUF4394 domain-containing protein n=1 Tax=Nostoc sp. TaxID=1180 RepID=UPI002FF3CB81